MRLCIREVFANLRATCQCLLIPRFDLRYNFNCFLVTLELNNKFSGGYSIAASISFPSFDKSRNLRARYSLQRLKIFVFISTLLLPKKYTSS